MPLKVSATLTAVLFIALALVGAPLMTVAAPLGIVSYELARTSTAANTILASWDAAARLHAAFSLGLDYLFMLAYSTFFVLAVLRAGDGWRLRGLSPAAFARPLAAGVVLAALLDAVENAALAVILFRGAAVSPWPLIAWLSASVKFSLLGLAAVYLLVSAGIRLLLHSQMQTSP